MFFYLIQYDHTSGAYGHALFCIDCGTWKTSGGEALVRKGGFRFGEAGAVYE